MQGQKKFLDSSAFRHDVADEKNPRHWLGCPNTFVGEIWHCVAIVGKEDAFLRRRPGQNGGIGRFGQVHVLHADGVQVAATALTAAL